MADTVIKKSILPEIQERGASVGSVIDVNI
jgi:hypothetical protein